VLLLGAVLMLLLCPGPFLPIDDSIDNVQFPIVIHFITFPIVPSPLPLCVWLCYVIFHYIVPAEPAVGRSQQRTLTSPLALSPTAEAVLGLETDSYRRRDNGIWGTGSGEQRAGGNGKKRDPDIDTHNGDPCTFLLSINPIQIPPAIEILEYNKFPRWVS